MVRSAGARRGARRCRRGDQGDLREHARTPSKRLGTCSITMKVSGTIAILAGLVLVATDAAAQVSLTPPGLGPPPASKAPAKQPAAKPPAKKPPVAPAPAPPPAPEA